MDGTGTAERQRRTRGELLLLARMIRANPDLPDARRAWTVLARGLAAEHAALARGDDETAARAAGQAARAAHAEATGIGELIALCARTCGGPVPGESNGAAAA